MYILDLHPLFSKHIGPQWSHYQINASERIIMPNVLTCHKTHCSGFRWWLNTCSIRTHRENKFERWSL